MKAPRPGRPAPTRRIRRVLAGSVLLLAGPLLAEAGTRLVDRWRGNPFDAERSREAIAALARSFEIRGSSPADLSPATTDPGDPERRILQPYVAWEVADTSTWMVEAAEDYARPEARAAFDVLILGGSTARSLARADTGPLVRLLEEDSVRSGRPIRLHVGAQDAFKQPQPSLLLAFLFAIGHEPDLVVEIDGRDEARLGLKNAQGGTHPLHPSVEPWSAASNGLRSDWELVERLHAVRESRRRARSFCRWTIDSGIFRSALLEHLATLRIERHRAAVLDADLRLEAFLAARPREKELDGPRYDPGEAAVAATIAKGWEEASISMHAMCARRGIAYFQVLEPEGATGSDEGPSAVHAKLREAGRRLERRGVPFLDATPLEPEGDPQRLARAVSQAILSAAAR